MQTESRRPASHPAVRHGRVGVLLVNLGTPSAPTAAAVKAYLAEFLSDRRVVELPALLWQPVLRGIILNVRPRKTAALYAAIWDHAGGGSPLMVITRAQAAGLQQALSDRVVVDWAMRYGQPAISERLAALQAQGCDRILLAPLYPQYCAATTATAFDAAAAALAQMRWQPSLRMLPPYHADDAYIAALAASLRPALDGADGLLLSFHGMPRRTLDAGDPYQCHCLATARRVREALGWPEDRFHVAFQSRFGRQEWLRPYAVDTVRELAQAGVRRLVVACPGFAADCLETLEEVRIGLADIFYKAGGTTLDYVPCLNATDDGIRMLRAIIGRELAGWSDAAVDEAATGA